MKFCCLWIDHDHAFIYEFTPTGTVETKILRPIPSNRHHHSTRDQKHKPTTAFYRVVAEKLYGADEILLMGAAKAKDEFKHYCQKERSEIARAIVVIVTTQSHPKPSDLVAKSKKYFKQLHPETWYSPIWKKEIIHGTTEG